MENLLATQPEATKSASSTSSSPTACPPSPLPLSSTPTSHLQSPSGSGAPSYALVASICVPAVDLQPSSPSCPSPSLCRSCYGLQPSLAPLPFVRWLTPSPSTSPPRPPHHPGRHRASAAAAADCLGAPPLRPLVDSEPINQLSSSSSSSPSLCCSCYGLQPALAPFPFVRWLTPSPSTSPPHRPVRLRASAAAATGCSLPWRPSPSSAGCLRAHQPALIIAMFVSEPLLQLLRAAACLGALPLRPLVDSEPINQLSSSSCSSPSPCCSCYGLQPFLGASLLRLLVDSEPINRPSSTSSSSSTSPRSSPSLCCSCCGLPWRPSPSSAGCLRAHQPALLIVLFVSEPLLQLLRPAACLGAPPLRPLVDSEPINRPSSSSCSSPSL